MRGSRQEAPKQIAPPEQHPDFQLKSRYKYPYVEQNYPAATTTPPLTTYFSLDNQCPAHIPYEARLRSLLSRHVQL